MDRLRDWLLERRVAADTVDGVLWNELSVGDEFGLAWLLKPTNLPTEKFETVLQIAADPVPVRAAFAQAMAHAGRLLDPSVFGPEVTLAGVVRGGFGNMNPAVVEVRITDDSGGGCLATLTATAREGRIKQRTAEKALARLTAAPELAMSGARQGPVIDVSAVAAPASSEPRTVGLPRTIAAAAAGVIVSAAVSIALSSIGLAATGAVFAGMAVGTLACGVIVRANSPGRWAKAAVTTVLADLSILVALLVAAAATVGPAG